MEAGATGNTVGGTTAAARNVISGNSSDGIDILDSGTSGNVVQGNYVGLNAAGTAGLGNGASYLGGIVIALTASNNTVGGGAAGAGNVISGNSGTGITISDAGTTGNKVQGNYIGTDAAGTGIPSNQNGVKIDSGASGNFIGTDGDGVNDATEGNLIAANNSASAIGVLLTDSGTSNNVVAGNTVGLNSAGAARGFGTGVFVTTGADDNRIGTNADGISDTAERNVISGNVTFGIQVTSGNGTDIFGNYIGTNAAGTASGGGTQQGIQFRGTIGSISIGGTATGAGNVISGNTGDGIVVKDSTVTGGTIQGNFIGLGAGRLDGRQEQRHRRGHHPECIEHHRRRHDRGGRNVISGNTGDGVDIGASTGDDILGNYIGTNASGTAAPGNHVHGIFLLGAVNTTIGGATAGAGNLISGNAGTGIYVQDTSSSGTIIQGNFIGTDAAGSADLGNGTGIYAEGANTTIGGATATPGTGAGNVISGNGVGPSSSGNIQVKGTGAAGTLIAGNLIGLNAAGTAAIDAANNDFGIDLLSTQGVTVGGSARRSCAMSFPVMPSTAWLLSRAPAAISCKGNYIGTNAAGTGAIANATGVEIDTSSTTNTIGGTAAGAGNVDRGNTTDGIFIGGANTFGNVVQGNYIGTNCRGERRPRQRAGRRGDYAERVTTTPSAAPTPAPATSSPATPRSGIYLDGRWTPTTRSRATTSAPTSTGTSAARHHVDGCVHQWRDDQQHHRRRGDWRRQRDLRQRDRH